MKQQGLPEYFDKAAFDNRPVLSRQSDLCNLSEERVDLATSILNRFSDLTAETTISREIPDKDVCRERSTFPQVLFADGKAFFNGLIDEVVLYNGDLTREAITNLHCADLAVAGVNLATDPRGGTCR